MTEAQIPVIRSRDNTVLKELRRLAQDSAAYRKQGRIWLEGDHLCRAALERGQKPVLAAFLRVFLVNSQRKMVIVCY
jgi:TrmH family RNA methyltransferase